VSACSNLASYFDLNSKFQPALGIGGRTGSHSNTTALADAAASSSRRLISFSGLSPSAAMTDPALLLAAARPLLHTARRILSVADPGGAAGNATQTLGLGNATDLAYIAGRGAVVLKTDAEKFLQVPAPYLTSCAGLAMDTAHSHSPP
jgi:hypothetical protein